MISELLFPLVINGDISPRNLILFFWLHQCHIQVPGPGTDHEPQLRLHHSCCNAGSLTHCATAGAPVLVAVLQVAVCLKFWALSAVLLLLIALITNNKYMLVQEFLSWLSSEELNPRVRSLASLSRLRLQCCCELWCRSQTWLWLWCWLAAVAPI